MKIYSMTATFGKLEHQTLTLQPGLNIIEAPNEWGKSTWCAFLVNMLYGIDTRARTTGAALADKERFAPWSGSAMSGRIDLCWNGRDITIERRSKGRVPFGDFKAYETETGIDVPELNGANCGQQLLGVERSVFTRAGFLKQADLPVTQDDSLRRRLNNLVTTGDESGTSDKLGDTLRDLKNKCRHNRTGLLPQAENERDQLKKQLDDLYDLRNQADLIRNAQTQLEDLIAKLENHGAALRYEAAQEDIRKVEEAEAATLMASQRLDAAMDACRNLPPQEQTQWKLRTAQQLQEEWMALQMESQMLPAMPEKPDVPEFYRDVDAVAVAKADAQKHDELLRSRKKNGIYLAVYGIVAAIMVVLGVMMAEIGVYFYALAAVCVLAAGITCLIRSSRCNKALKALCDRHPGIDVMKWVSHAEDFVARWRSYEAMRDEVTRLRGDVDQRTADLKAKMDDLTGGASMAQCQTDWADTVASWDALGDARRDLQHAQNHEKTLRSMLRTAEPAKEEDALTYTAEENERILTEARFKQRQLHTKLGQCLGQTEAIGSETVIRGRIETLNRRIARLEDTYYALEMAQDALRDATNTLQRRFAPRISKRAQELFGQLTGGRYVRLSLGSDFSLSASAQEEDTLRTAQWRSDGTADQLYLALRLAVAEELTPDAPLILDDAFVRFDDKRLLAAMKILKEESENKQVIIFTCQSREKQMEEQL